MSQIAETVNAVRADMNRVLLERTQAVDYALLALLTKQHYLMTGPPGTAKSMLVDAVQARIVGSQRFKRVLNPGTTDADLLGPQDLIQMADHGRYVRRHARSIVEAHLAFLDEIGRANKLVYDLLLQILNEREVDEVGMDAPLSLPLITCFGASNSPLSGSDDLAALNNRFLLREEIVPLSERGALIQLAKTPPDIRDVQATMTLDDLREAQAEAKTVRCTGEVLDACLDLKETLAREGVCVSDRMWVWSFPLLKAHAWLHGESEVQLDDLVALGGAWWQDPKERPVVQRAIFSVACPLAATALEIQDDFTDLVKQAPAPDAADFVSEGLGINAQLKDMVTRLMTEVKGSKARDKAPAIRALQQISTAQRQFAATLASRMNVGSVDISDVVSVA